jgi:predicted dienelactone hydrolase
MSRQRMLQFVLVAMLIISFLVGCGVPAATPVAEAPTIPPTITSAQPTSPPTAQPTLPPLTAQLTPSPQATSTAVVRADVPKYGMHGPYAVGTRDFDVKNGDQTVTFTAWYPALNPDHAPEEITYRISEQNSNAANMPIKGRAIHDAAPDTSQGPYPLVIYSTGGGAWRQVSVYLLEHLASYGFVVMSSDPRGEAGTEFWAGAATRPIDTKLAISFADNAKAPNGALGGMFDTKHIAIVGYSSGGWNALVGGGAQFDFGWCAAHPDIVAATDPGDSDCAQFVPHAKEIAALLGLKAVPSGLWPSMNDPRVRAVLALAPDGDIWGANYEGVAGVKVPALIMNGTKDKVNPPDRTAYPIYQHLGSAQKGIIKFENAGHFVFADQCRDVPWMPSEYCAQVAWDMDRAHDLTNHFATAFLLTELKGDKEAANALVPENVSFPGIEYETSGFTATK